MTIPSETEITSRYNGLLMPEMLLAIVESPTSGCCRRTVGSR